MRFLIIASTLVLALPCLAETIDFPTDSDTWEISSANYWWHEGDTVYGDRTVTAPASQADVYLNIPYNSLSGDGYVELEFTIGPEVIGYMVILPSHGTGIVSFSFTFPTIPPGTHEFRYYETNLVCGGCGSIQIDPTGGYVELSGTTAVQPGTWSSVKSIY
ncbi:MAG: hypothetical protein QF492_01845 [Candidatus Krumholzibacteria bacterium]|jgi:hypothetical protein|nr:hypothetical protein [Candidatus Krumholzibacteria bacterium]MDP6668637.1 hypothetical protein [Candidatus Krumholzibacteria bacterium]MDP6798189.1 hypothetical protein [Candidatus Krumholzibacteria bacterium]MDP7022412.1 hypothetical protein [Candidatus Krumholzibacteria bacterium]